MATVLGTLEELPQDYRDAMTARGVAPLWPQLRNVMPHHAPKPVTQSHLWPYADIRPLVLKSGELTPVEKAERRVLYLVDPGRGGSAMQATATIYVGLQLLLPGEAAPNHRHTPSAARILVEGEGGYTVVDGEKLPMHPGDLILTPSGSWHDHGHDGSEPVIWLDALDLPLFVHLEGSYAVEAPLQAPRNRPDPSELAYRASGLVPSRRRDRPAPTDFPMMRYPWTRTEDALRRLAEHNGGEAVELDYVNPETGESCLPTMGFTAMMLRPGEVLRPPQRSSSAVFHVIAGKGTSIVEGVRHDWVARDTFSAPVFAKIEHRAADDEPAFLIRIHDAPLQERLGYYEERERR
jgi:gentisate 1,2-dioxygenase